MVKVDIPFKMVKKFYQFYHVFFEAEKTFDLFCWLVLNYPCVLKVSPNTYGYICKYDGSLTDVKRFFDIIWMNMYCET